MQSILRLVDRADAFLARLNPGLAAVAIVLTFAVVAGWAARHPEIFQVQYGAAAAAVGMEPVDARSQAEALNPSPLSPLPRRADPGPARG